MDLITSISTSLDIVGKLRDLNKKIGDADFKMMLADLTSELADAKLDAANLKSELAELKSENQRLLDEAQRKTEAAPEIINDTYRFPDDSRPICTKCYDAEGKKITLAENTGPFIRFGKYKCPNCNNNYGYPAGG